MSRAARSRIGALVAGTAPDANARRERGQRLVAARGRSAAAPHGLNLLGQTEDRPLLWHYLARFKNPLIVILLSAGAASALVSGFVNFTIISLIVLLGVTLDFMQEYRANSAAQTLRRSVSLRATVVRDGSATTIPAAAVVPGDVALLSAGDMVPAGAPVLAAHDFFVQQALLTGEAYPVEKRQDAPPRTACDIAGATNAVFMGPRASAAMPAYWRSGPARAPPLGGGDGGIAAPGIVAHDRLGHARARRAARCAWPGAT